MSKLFSHWSEILPGTTCLKMLPLLRLVQNASIQSTDKKVQTRQKTKTNTHAHTHTHTHTNEVMRCRWSGQVRVRNGKTLEELKSKMRHMRAQFQNKTGNNRTTKTRIILLFVLFILCYHGAQAVCIVVF